MASLPGGTFFMGSDEFYPEERPVREVTVGAFAIDRHPVTVAEFRRFVTDTGYVTLAERPPDPALYPDADPDLLVPGSLVFQRTQGPVRLDDVRAWWAYVPGACWTAPEGQARALAAATATRSRTSPTRTRSRTRSGPARTCRPRPNGNTPRAVAWTASASRGVTKSQSAGG